MPNVLFSVSKAALGGAAIAFSLVNVPAVHANGVSENLAWQFETTQDKVNRAYLENLRQQKIGGYYNYAPPVYTTNIDKQYNCAVSATSTGNSSSSSASGASQGLSGTSASSVGNTSSTDQLAGMTSATNGSTTDQNNTGKIISHANGDVDAHANVDANQVLNTDQNNSGDQTSTVNGSTSCQFGLLN
ncbi:hypothetical protein OVA07_02140 [Novosphingobium sp. SL115]|uniref:hypothetical protein n=1 Tax=Novosphingobium sp. SL115 TaxID=2995150 RepID=UPI002273AA7D|nr:hypothetical protein [Novosphingobium sp. SL115]MCY1669806.1 hypothetical protein [Novosphingobium sp. SL115]